MRELFYSTCSADLKITAENNIVKIYLIEQGKQRQVGKIEIILLWDFLKEALLKTRPYKDASLNRRREEARAAVKYTIDLYFK